MQLITIRNAPSRTTTCPDLVVEVGCFSHVELSGQVGHRGETCSIPGITVGDDGLAVPDVLSERCPAQHASNQRCCRFSTGQKQRVTENHFGPQDTSIIVGLHCDPFGEEFDPCLASSNDARTSHVFCEPDARSVWCAI